VSGSGYREHVFKDRGELASAVAEGLVALSRSPDGEGRAVAPSGGSRPKRRYETLARWLDEAASSGA
jgi:hypothetical protein